MQIKSTMRYNLTPVRMVIIKMTRDKKFWSECRQKGTLHNALSAGGCWRHMGEQIEDGGQKALPAKYQ